MLHEAVPSSAVQVTMLVIDAYCLDLGASMGVDSMYHWAIHSDPTYYPLANYYELTAGQCPAARTQFHNPCKLEQ